MNFVKQNVFLVVVVVVLLVGTGALYAWWSAGNGDVEAAAAEATAADGRLSSAMGGPKVGPNTQEEWANQSQTVKQIADQTAVQHMARNCSRFAILSLNSGGMNVPAFPMKAGSTSDMKIAFCQAYCDAARSLLAELKPTTPPTQKMIDDKVKEVTPAERTEPTDVAPAAGEPADKSLSREAKARNQVIVDRAKAGLIYADEKSLEIPFDPKNPDASLRDSSAWLYQVSLWVQQDIVSAIAAVNAEAQQTAVTGDVGVPRSSIKRLLEMHFRGYVVGRSNGPATGAPGMAPVAAAPMADPSMPFQSLTYIAPPNKQGTGGGSMESMPNLTGRASDQLRDVVHYQFKVIMRPQDIQRLLRQLQTMNYHTILDCRFESIKNGAATPAAGGPIGADSVSETNYYYGPDPVVQVSIVGELQMLAAWTRGTWDDQKNEWTPNAPQLMPVDMLGQIAANDPSALRPKDQQSLPQGAAPVGGGMPGGPAFPTAAPAAPAQPGRFREPAFN